MLACSNESLYEDFNFLPETPPVVEEMCTFVSMEQASSVAQAFLNKHIDAAISTRMAASEPTITTVEEDGVPQMYIINYPNGGWAIVSATRNYFPILAFSEKGYFVLNEEAPGGLLAWMEDTQESIKRSVVLDDETRFNVRSMWRRYEAKENDAFFEIEHNNAGTTRSWSRFNERVAELQQQYHLLDYRFYRLSDLLFTCAGAALPSWSIQGLYNRAIEFQSPLEFTIVGIRVEAISHLIGPLLTTRWHQNYPFNSATPFRDAGCGPVAMAQIMNFHRFPQQIIHNGHFINWNNMPDAARTNSEAGSAPQLIAYAGLVLGASQWPGGTAVFPWRVVEGFQWASYSATRRNHNNSEVINELINNRRPVMMFGSRNTVNVTNSHYWVCDGVIRGGQRIFYFAKFLKQGWIYVRGSHHVNCSYMCGCNPGVVLQEFTMFHMNWGWDSRHNGWFTGANSPLGNFQHHRRNYFIHPR